MRIHESRGVNTLAKWLLLSLFFLLTGSTPTSEADIAVDADATPSPCGMSKRSLQPKPSPPCPYSYELKNRDGNVCLKAVLGVQYMVTLKKKFYYFNNPQTTRATGYCGNQTAVLSLESNEMYLEFTFVKKSKEYYTHKLRARLGPISVCDNNKCENYSYPETVNNEQLFKTTTGLSFKCKSQLVVKMSPNLRLKIMSAQFQPFDLSNGQFGKDFECWQDYINRIIPIIVGAIAVGILLIATVSYLVVREYRHRNYESM